MQYPESTSVAVVQAWPEPGSLKPRGGHHLEPQGSRAYSSAVPRVIFFSARRTSEDRWLRVAGICAGLSHSFGFSCGPSDFPESSSP